MLKRVGHTNGSEVEMQSKPVVCCPVEGCPEPEEGV